MNNSREWGNRFNLSVSEMERLVAWVMALPDPLMFTDTAAYRCVWAAIAPSLNP
ncbi:hypothetical protein IQ268_10685 [Oculatella sp. LEGE 06141]|uniref:hypothetical protein n=1 Tax=Oculatella sp. LEGE 06141 TaxID=1828648 RepID=UPI001882E322|nr:hypothetical protein [Oculatella sp. LEGE 06141]MBE9179026.1 hypothetical protein [Oculatella sp. LEGE 06141]